MFILTSVSVNNDCVSVYDTSDNSNETVRLSVLASRIKNNSIKVCGVGNIESCTRADAYFVEYLGIYISVNEAKEALYRVEDVGLNS